MAFWFIKNNKPSRALAVVVLWCLVAGLCAATYGDSSTTRVVSLVPGLTETCFAIGAGPQVVGVSDYCAYPAEARTRPRVGGLSNPRLEQLLLLRPTVILLYRSQADFAHKLRILKIDCRLFALDRLSDIYEAAEQLGGITGKRAEAHVLVRSMREQFEAMHARTSETAAVRAVVLVSRDPGDLRNLFQAGPKNFLGELMNLAGGSHAIATDAAITKEQLILGNPQVIIDLSGGESASTAEAKEAALRVWAQLPTIDAVKNHHVYYPAAAHALVPGPYLVEAAKEFERMLHR
ncbi:MAG: ABC transporter substrate-binding protein [Candidatus Sumerlaeaceae bacterium]